MFAFGYRILLHHRCPSSSFPPVTSRRCIGGVFPTRRRRHRLSLANLSACATSPSPPFSSVNHRSTLIKSLAKLTVQLGSITPTFQTTRSLVSLLRHLFHFSTAEPFIRTRLLLATLYMLLSKLFLISVPFIFKRFLEILACPRTVSKTLPLLLIAYFAAKGVAIIFQELHIVAFSLADQRLERHLSRDVFAALHTLGASWYTTVATGSVVSIFHQGISAIRTIFRLLISSFAPSVFELGLVLTVMGVNGWWGTMGVVVITFMVYLWWTLTATEELARARKTMIAADNDGTAVITDSLINYEVVSMFDNADLETRRYDTFMKTFEDAGVRMEWRSAFLDAGKSIIFAAGLSVVFFLTAAAVWSESETVGDMVMIAALLQQFWVPLGAVGMQYEQLRRSVVEMQNLFQVIETEPTVKEVEGARHLRVSEGELIFEHVNFSYSQSRAQSSSLLARESVVEQKGGYAGEDSESEQVILRDLTFRVPPGKTFAIVGESGSGKSTALRLLYRLYDIDGGRILIDGQDICQVSLSSLRGSIAIVPQDTILFNDTIGYNIRYGHPEASMREVVAAAKAANIHESILRMKDGYNTLCGERGVKLSGGERQRLSAARAFLKNCRILVLDEATSSLDSKTEAEISRALKTLGANKTILVIAHRLSTVSGADWILVLNKGVVVEEGTHESLLKIKGGLYKDMWERQQDSTYSATKRANLGRLDHTAS